MELFTSLKLVKAGQAGKVIPTTVEVNTQRLENVISELDGRQLYCISGESLAPEGIHTGDILVVTDITMDFDVEAKLKYGTFIILRISEKNNEDNCVSNKSDLKIRKYIATIDITKSDDVLWKEIQEIDKFSDGEYLKNLFSEKYKKAKERIIETDDQKNVILSITYTAEHGREYSFHSRKRLCAKVDFYIDKDNIKH